MSAFLTFRHYVMHGNRQEEDGVTVVRPRASAEVLLHGLNDGEQLLCESHYVMEQHLQGRSTWWCHISTICSNCRRASTYSIQLYAKVWAPLTISIIFIYKSLGVCISNSILIYQITDGHSNISVVFQMRLLSR